MNIFLLCLNIRCDKPSQQNICVPHIYVRGVSIHNTQYDAEIHAGLYIKATEAERIVGVERRTLFRWAQSGRLPFVRHGKRGHWMFDRYAVCNLVHKSANDRAVFQEQDQTTETAQKESSRIDAIYARVSTRKQLEYLETQVQSLKTKYPSSIVFRDCASGLNFRRKGLLSLLQRVLEGRVRVVHLAYRDRLCRFAYDLIERIFKHYNTEITVEAHNVSSAEGELAEDVLSIITVFSARMYGRRSGIARGIRR